MEREIPTPKYWLRLGWWQVKNGPLTDPRKFCERSLSNIYVCRMAKMSSRVEKHQIKTTIFQR